jgi:hypothetical protein
VHVDEPLGPEVVPPCLRVCGEAVETFLRGRVDFLQCIRRDVVIGFEARSAGDEDRERAFARSGRQLNG